MPYSPLKSTGRRWSAVWELSMSGCTDRAATFGHELPSGSHWPLGRHPASRPGRSGSPDCRGGCGIDRYHHTGPGTVRSLRGLVLTEFGARYQRPAGGRPSGGLGSSGASRNRTCGESDLVQRGVHPDPRLSIRRRPSSRPGLWLPWSGRHNALATSVWHDRYVGGRHQPAIDLADQVPADLYLLTLPDAVPLGGRWTTRRRAFSPPDEP